MDNVKVKKSARRDIPDPRILGNILKELRLLRHTMSLLLPREDLDEYANPHRIERSYRKALKNYPLASP